MTLNNQPMSRIWWLWIPLAIMAVQFVLEFTLPTSFLKKLHSENGPHELVEFIVLCFAFLVAARTIVLPELKGCKWLRGWIILAAVCCFYVAGEEVSWGQHFILWSTPDYWMGVNDQGETNLHNTSSWLDQKPRILLELGALIGGIIIPLLLRFKPQWVPKRFMNIYPPAILCIPPLLIIFMKIINMIDQPLLGFRVFERPSEVQEVYLFYFTLLYLVILRRRILQGQR
jgi:hypothetical protein